MAAGFSGGIATAPMLLTSPNSDAHHTQSASPDFTRGVQHQFGIRPFAKAGRTIRCNKAIHHICPFPREKFVQVKRRKCLPTAGCQFRLWRSRPLEPPTSRCLLARSRHLGIAIQRDLVLRMRRRTYQCFTTTSVKWITNSSMEQIDPIPITLPMLSYSRRHQW